MASLSHFSDFDLALAQSYAVHLRPIIPSVARNLCYGCVVNHPSQVQHDICILMNEEERILHCLSEALQLVDEKKILKLFKRITNFKSWNIKPAYVFYDTSLKNEWSTEWRALVCQEIIRLDTAVE